MTLVSASRRVPREDNELCEHEGYEMSKVHAIAAWPTSRVEEKRFPLLIAVKDGIELADGRNS